MTTYTKKISVLFNEDITSYAIGKAIGSSAQFVDNYRVGKSKIENMKLGKAEKLVEYFDNYKSTQAFKMYEELRLKNDVDYAIVLNDKVLVNHDTDNINGIFSQNGYFGVYGDVIGGQIDTRDSSFGEVLDAIKKILSYGKPVKRSEVESKGKGNVFYE